MFSLLNVYQQIKPHRQQPLQLHLRLRLQNLLQKKGILKRQIFTVELYVQINIFLSMLTLVFLHLAQLH